MPYKSRKSLHFILMSIEPRYYNEKDAQILSDYPRGGPEMPTRTKFYRSKDRHLPGTGRKDTVKREGKGPFNIGTYKDDAKYMEEREQGEGAGPESIRETPERTPASKYFSASEEEEVMRVEVPRRGKTDIRVSEEFADMITTKNARIRVIRPEEMEEEEAEEMGLPNPSEIIRRQKITPEVEPQKIVIGNVRRRSLRRMSMEEPTRYRTREEEPQEDEEKKQRWLRRFYGRKSRDKLTSGVQHQRITVARAPRMESRNVPVFAGR